MVTQHRRISSFFDENWYDVIIGAKSHLTSDNDDIYASGWLPVMLFDQILVSHMTSNKVK